ncbi:MAG: S8 family serine peptidase [bacterium]
MDMSPTELIATIESWQPAGLDPQLADELRRAMLDMVESDPRERWTSKAPEGVANRIADLSVGSDGSNTVLSWSYRNKGDYDNNSEANVSDLTALGSNLGRSSADPDWHDKAKYADGDGNGEVNISDVTPLGSNLLSQVAAYRVLGATADGVLAEVGTVAFQDGDARVPHGFSFSIADDSLKLFAVEPLDASGNAGIRSGLAGSGVVLDMLPGEPQDSAVGAIPAIPVPAAADELISSDDRTDGTMLPTLRNRILVSLSPQATVAAVNALLADQSASIVGGIPTINLLAIEIADSGDFSGLDTLHQAIDSSGIADFAAPDVLIGPTVTDNPSTAADPTPTHHSGNSPAGMNPNPWSWSLPPSVNAAADGNWNMEAVRAPQMWNLLDHARRMDSAPVTVVLDAGFNDTNGDGIDDHPQAELADIRHYRLNQSGGYAPGSVTFFHGEHVAGIVGAEYGNNTGICGINPLVQRGGGGQQFFGVSIRSFNSGSSPFTAIIQDVEGILTSPVFQGPDILNMSLGYNIRGNSGWMVDGNRSQAVKTLAANQGLWFRRIAARHPETLIIVAAGNDSVNLPAGDEELAAHWASPWAFAGTGPDVPELPKSPNVLVVESLDAIPANSGDAPGSWQYTKSDFSNVGGDLAAPGGRILSTVGSNMPPAPPPNGNFYDDYETTDGTSMATPLVSGLAGFLLNVDPALSVADLRSLLTGASSSLPSVRAAGEAPLPPGVTGAADRVDAFAAATAIDGLRGNHRVQQALADVDDGTADGNLRQDPFTGGGFSGIATADGRRGDGRVTMRDFRAFRDAYLQVHSADFSGGVLLDGEATHFKKDLNFDGAVAMMAVSPGHPADVSAAGSPAADPGENVYPRYDFNGDGEIGDWKRTSPYRSPLSQQPADDASYSPHNAPGMLRDIDVLASADWQPDMLADGSAYDENVVVDSTLEGQQQPGAFWQPARALLGNRDGSTNAPAELKDVPDYLHSMDLHLKVDFAQVPAGLESLEVTVLSEIWPDGVDNNGGSGVDEAFEERLERRAIVSRSTPQPITLTVPLWTGKLRVAWNSGNESFPLSGVVEAKDLKFGEDHSETIPRQVWSMQDLGFNNSIGGSGNATGQIDDMPVIAAYNGGSESVVFRMAKDPQALEWEDYATVYAGTGVQICGMSTAGDKPGIMLRRLHPEGADILYARAATENGSSWLPPVTVSTISSGYNALPILRDIAGRPAVCYAEQDINFELQRVRYQIATSADGSAWLGAQQVQPYADHFVPLDMIDLGGSPAIALHQRILEGGEFQTVFMRGTSAEGGFGSSVVIGGPLEGTLSLAVVDGKPAACAVFNESLSYLAASDELGNGWSAGAVLHTYTDFSQSRDNFMVLLNDRPAVGYSENGNIYYRFATDMSGSTWSDPATLFSNPGGKTFINLEGSLVQGRPQFTARGAATYNYHFGIQR